MPDFLTNLLANPLGLFIIAGVVLLVLALNLPMLYILRGQKPKPRSEQHTWGRAFRGGFDARQDQMAQIDELQRRVAQLPPPPPE